MRNTEIIEHIAENDLEKYKNKGYKVSYPFPVEDFALKVFGLDILYINFSECFSSKKEDIKKIYGALYPDRHYYNGYDKVILVNTDREDFYINELIIPKELYIKESERQTIAHEIGHYSELKNNPDLFSNVITMYKFENIFLKDREIFANKYARILMMPKDEVKKLKSKKEIIGAIDMVRDAIYFKEYFGITQFMLEIRLKELNISFTNGYYINSNQKTKGDKYTEEDLLTLINLSNRDEFNPHYGECELIAKEYNKIRNQDRASGPLYMAIWRINQGVYDNIQSVLELRMRLALNKQKNNS